MKIAICGSMQFAKEMLETKKSLEDLGHIATAPTGTEMYASGDRSSENKWDKEIGDVIKEWYEEIKRSDAILVVNKTKNDIENYIGGNGLMEIGFAYILGKKIFLLNSIPKLAYTDEIEAMKPIVLDGYLDLVK